MDVTLERVQFKFASIIGELCSKPVILSQFAIWVDLRLAEYKLKGAISLDCSGDKPDPDWLKGMKDSDEASPDYPDSEHHRSPSRGRSINHNRSFGETTDGSHIKQIDIPNRLSADAEFGDSTAIVIKNDSDDEGHVFPTGLHVHESTNYNHRRKRSRESGLDRGEDGLYTVMHHKMLKSSEPSMATQSSNQSLMSIIGGQDSVIEASPVSLEESQRDIDLGMAIQIQESQHMGDNSSFIAGRPSSHATSTITQSSHEIDISFNSPLSKSTRFANLSGHLLKSGTTRHFSKRILSDVRKFESWIRGPEFNETRQIQDIPPEELDGYMASFLRGVKTRHGDNYDPDSLHSLRGNIDRYLKDCTYPFSLTKSAQFRQSQAVMKMQRKQLIEDISLSYSELVTLKDNNLLKWTDADKLLQTLFTVMSVHFGTLLKTRSDHCKLYWGDLELDEYPPPNGSLVLTGNMSSTEGNSRLSKTLGKRSLRAPADLDNPECCPVKLYTEYKKRRTPENLTPDSRFYLRPSVLGDPNFWFSGPLPVNNHFLGQIARDLKTKLHDFQSPEDQTMH